MRRRLFWVETNTWNRARPRGPRLVEAAGVERERSAFSNFLMARDFWGERVLSVAVAAAR